MQASLKLLLVAGARPNFMKIAPLIHALRGSEFSPEKRGAAIDYFLVHTGQHYDEKMSDVFFRELGIPKPHASLDVGSGTHAAQTAQTMIRFEPVCQEQRPDWVVVVGDVNSTAACTLVAAKLGVKVAHVEAGLRSFDRTMPEEINRLVTDAIADLLLTPSEDASENLRREGVPEGKIRLVGNIMIDSLVANLPQARASGIMATMGIQPGRFVFVTLHRPANVDDKNCLRAIMNQLSALSKRLPIIFPVHPRTRKMLQEHGIATGANPQLRIIDPVGYHDSLCLTENARLVLTDSGGLQEESTYFRTPCLTLRPNTERPVTITLGSNKLCGVNEVENKAGLVLAGPDKLGVIPPLWDGDSAGHVLRALVDATVINGK